MAAFYDKFTLPEGECELRWPAELSEESKLEMAAWLGLVMRRVNRNPVIAARAVLEETK